MIDSSSSSPTPPLLSSTHLCLMAKGERKVSNDDDSSGDEHASNDDSDSDDEFDHLPMMILSSCLTNILKLLERQELKMKS